MATWIRRDELEAEAEGWGIFDAGTLRHPRIEIQRVDEAGIFAGDDAALKFVRQAAAHGHPLATKALAVIAEENTKEQADATSKRA